MVEYISIPTSDLQKVIFTARLSKEQAKEVMNLMLYKQILFDAEYEKELNKCSLNKQQKEFLPSICGVWESQSYERLCSIIDGFDYNNLR